MSAFSPAARETPGSTGSPGFPARSVARQRTLLLCLLLTVAVLVSYNPVVHNGFLNYDDGLHRGQPSRERGPDLGDREMGLYHLIIRRTGFP
jgi:hypothetical protein